MKTALVLGAGGFIGNHMVDRLKSEGFWVRGVDLKETEFEIYFARIDWGATFDLFPKVEITYDPEFQELSKNED